MLVAGVAVLATFSCEKKKPSTDIIAPKPVKEVKRGPQKMNDIKQERSVAWVGNQYKVVMNRTPDSTLPMAKDESNNQYYDNKIVLKIIRTDGSEFFNRTFTKADFSQYIPEDYRQNGALLGIVLDKADGDYLRFAASVGSPDVLSDQFIPLVMTIHRMGGVNITRDTQLDTGADDATTGDEDEDGV